MKCKKTPKFACHGNSLPEYVLIACLIVILSVTGLSNVGKNLGNWLAFLKGDMSQHVTSAQAAEAIAQAEAATIPGTGSGSSDSGGGTTTACINGKCIDIPSSLTGSSLTLGANGDERVAQLNAMADAFDQLAAMLKDDPSVDPLLAKYLTELALAGHANANTQADMLKFDSGTLTAEQIANSITGFDGSYSDYQALLTKVAPLMGQLPPSTADTINNAIAVTSAIIDPIHNAAAASSANGTTFDYGSAVSKTTVELTHSESNTICNNGGVPPLCTVP